METPNPYEVTSDDGWPAPFADRSAALARLRQQVADGTAPAMAVMGRGGIGKTALLRQLDATADESVVTVYVALDDTPIDSEEDWLLALAQSATEELVRRDFTLSRLAHMQPPGDDARAWLFETFLSEFLSIIRPHRRIAFLLDDVDLLLDAINRSALPVSTFDFLYSLKQRRPQMTFVASIDDRRAADLSRLEPLIDSGDVIRLNDLTQDATAELLRQPVSGLYDVSDEAATAVFRATGGYPPLARAFGAALFDRQRRQSDQTIITSEDVKAVTQAIYAQAAPSFARTWAALPLNERLVLGSISTLTYDDPLSVIDTQAIAAWLVETDYLLDVTAINAALRSLEYAELISAAPNGGHAVHAAMMQRWLLENAHVGEAARQPVEPTRSRPRLLWVAVAIIAVAVIAVAVMLSRTDAPQSRPPSDAPPTVTLIGP